MKRPSLRRRKPRLRKRAATRTIRRLDTPQDYIDAWLWLTLRPGFEFQVANGNVRYRVNRVWRNRVRFAEVGHSCGDIVLNRTGFLSLHGVREALKAQPGTAFHPSNFRRDTP